MISSNQNRLSRQSWVFLPVGLQSPFSQCWPLLGGVGACPKSGAPPGRGGQRHPLLPGDLSSCHPLLGLTLWMNSSRATASSKLGFLASLALPGACNLASPGGNPAFAKRTHWISRNFPRWNSQEACIREALWSSSKGLSAGPRKGQDKAMQRQPAPTPPMHFPLH